MVTESHQHADGKVHAHITPARTYWAIFIALIIFTVLTVAVSYVHLGPLNLVVAIVIATIKASLVVLYFMHMKYEAKFNVLVFLGSLLFLGIFLAYTMNDTEQRAAVDFAYGGRVDPRTGEFAHGTPQALVAQEQARREREAERAREARQGGPAAVPAVTDEEAVDEPAEDEADDADAAEEDDAAADETTEGEPVEGGEDVEDAEDTAEADEAAVEEDGETDGVAPAPGQ